MSGGGGGGGGRALAARLRFWFGFADPVDRRAYFTNGAALMLCKYAVDAAAIGLATGRFWTPLDYLNPVWSLREQTLRLGPTWVVVALTAFALPFLWIGVSLTTRRAVDAGWSAWSGLVFFIPVANYVQMLVLSLVPSRPRRPWQRTEPAPVMDERLRSAMLGIAAGLTVAIPTVLVSVFVAKSYANALFLGTPFTLGAIAAHVHNTGHPRTLGETLQVAIAAVTLACGTIVLFAIEGIVCVAMAFPIAVGLAGLGAILGRAIALRSAEPPEHAGMAMLLLPLVALLDGRGAPPPPHEVASIVEIAAPPEQVWKNVVAFADLPPPSEWLFRAGIAAPLRARIEGRGPGGGAVRYCEFTTGTFVEPITRWEEPRALDFDITAQPAPLHELSPYQTVHATHLNGYFRAIRGGFRLVALPGGGTRLEGRTTYEVEMYPQVYWSLYADRIVEAIHQRVLRHIKGVTEQEPVKGR